MGANGEDTVGPSGTGNARPTQFERAKAPRIRDLLIRTIVPLIRASAVLVLLFIYEYGSIFDNLLKPLLFIYNLSIINLNFIENDYISIFLVFNLIFLFLTQHTFTLFQNYILKNAIDHSPTSPLRIRDIESVATAIFIAVLFLILSILLYFSNPHYFHIIFFCSIFFILMAIGAVYTTKRKIVRTPHGTGFRWKSSGILEVFKFHFWRKNLSSKYSAVTLVVFTIEAWSFCAATWILYEHTWLGDLSSFVKEIAEYDRFLAVAAVGCITAIASAKAPFLATLPFAVFVAARTLIAAEFSPAASVAFSCSVAAVWYIVPRLSEIAARINLKKYLKLNKFSKIIKLPALYLLYYAIEMFRSIRNIWILIALPGLFLFFPQNTIDVLIIDSEFSREFIFEFGVLSFGILLIWMAIHAIWLDGGSGPNSPLWILIRLCVGLSGIMLAATPVTLFEISGNANEWTIGLLWAPIAVAIVFGPRSTTQTTASANGGT